MDDRHRTILRKGRMIFIRDLSDLEVICDQLYACGVLTEGMCNDIKASVFITVY